MSKVSDVNNTAVTGAQAIFILKENLKSAGWTVPRSSDGTTYNSSGDQITHAGSGAGGMENNRAWFVIQSPNGEHQWCFQKEVTDNAEWRVKVSPLDGFTGGTPNATVVPSATDEQTIHGGGTDASPTMADLFPADGNYNFHVVAENAPIGTAVPIYGFWAVACTSGGIPCTSIMQEPMAPGSFPELVGTRSSPTSGDPDPCIYQCSFNISGDPFNFRKIQALSEWNGWYKYNYVGEEAWQSFDAAQLSSDYEAAPQVSAGGFGSNPYNGADDAFPIATYRDNHSGFNGFKGFTNFLRISSVDRQFPNTINLATDAMVYAGDILLPWENNTAPVV